MRDNINAIEASALWCIEWKILEGTNIAFSRNNGVTCSNGLEWADYILQWDSDVYIKDDPVGYLSKIIAECRPVIFGAYPFRDEHLEGCYTAGKIVGEGETNFYYPIVGAKGVKKVGWAGAGWCLCKSDVYSNIPDVWYNFDDNNSESYNFCKCLDIHGYDRYINFDNPLKHERVEVSVEQSQKTLDLVGTCANLNEGLTNVQYTVNQLKDAVTNSLNARDKQIAELKKEIEELKEAKKPKK